MPAEKTPIYLADPSRATTVPTGFPSSHFKLSNTPQSVEVLRCSCSSDDMSQVLNQAGDLFSSYPSRGGAKTTPNQNNPPNPQHNDCARSKTAPPEKTLPIQQTGGTLPYGIDPSLFPDDIDSDVMTELLQPDQSVHSRPRTRRVSHAMIPNPIELQGIFQDRRSTLDHSRTLDPTGTVKRARLDDASFGRGRSEESSPPEQSLQAERAAQLPQSAKSSSERLDSNQASQRIRRSTEDLRRSISTTPSNSQPTQDSTVTSTTTEQTTDSSVERVDSDPRQAYISFLRQDKMTANLRILRRDGDDQTVDDLPLAVLKKVKDLVHSYNLGKPTHYYDWRIVGSQRYRNLCVHCHVKSLSNRQGACGFDEDPLRACRRCSVEERYCMRVVDGQTTIQIPR